MATKRLAFGLVVVLLLPHVLGASQEPRKYLVFGHGSASCSAWTEEATNKARTGSPSMLHELRMAWLLGFMTGVGAAGFDLKDMDTPAMEGFINNYCQQNPLVTISVAAHQLALEMAKP
jgi:hypothetical protein